jgi:hypothetical protein
VEARQRVRLNEGWEFVGSLGNYSKDRAYLVALPMRA